MQAENFIEKLSLQLLTKLPGFEVQLKMAPPHRGTANLQNEFTKQGAVLFLLYKKNNEWHTVFIQRPINETVHSGQISLPGGKAETNDFSNVYNALRETEEEIGVPINGIKIIGNLTPLYIPPSNFWVHPIIGFIDKVPEFKIQISEVDALVEVPLACLFNSKNKGEQQVFKSENKTEKIIVPVYNLPNKKYIWGATAMMIAELEAICEF
jgi:8-oxo-dGTP pyrophosphatase MutT (NUDIX family)